MRKHADPRLISVTELMHHGDAVASEYPALYDELVAATKGEDVAVLCTTSGTTANPEAGDAAGRAHHPPLRQLP